MLDPNAAERITQQIDAARTAATRWAGSFEVVAAGVPVGLGSHAQWDRRLTARLRVSALSAIKGVELGLLPRLALPGSMVHDAYLPGDDGALTKYATNRAGHRADLDRPTDRGTGRDEADCDLDEPARLRRLAHR